MAQFNTFNTVEVWHWRILEGIEARLSCLERPTFEVRADVLDFRVTLLEAKLRVDKQHGTPNTLSQHPVTPNERLADLAIRISELEKESSVAYNFRETLQSDGHITCPDKSCDHRFLRAGDLSTHYESNHGLLLRPLTVQTKCYPCGKGFSRPGALTTHEKRFHGENYLSRAELFLPFHKHNAQLFPDRSRTQSLDTSPKAKQKIPGSFTYDIQAQAEVLLARSSDAVRLLQLFVFLGTKIPKVLLNRGCLSQRRWSDDCETREITPIEAGLDRDVFLLLSNKTTLSKATTSLLSLSLLGSEKTGNGHEIFIFDHKLRNSIQKRLSQAEKDFWSTQATILFCHASYRSHNLEPL
jgi:hypothetical protein